MRTGYGITSKIAPSNGAGSVGPQGPKGDAGPAGNTGGIGPMGGTGQNGLPGVKGDTGTQGPIGPTGNAGAQGLPGLDAKRIDTYNGTTDANGLFTVVYATSFPAIPSVQPEPPTASNQVWVKVASTTTGFSLRLIQRGSVTLLATEVLLAAVTNVVGAAAKVVVVAA